MNAGHEPGADLGPVISPESKQRILDLVESGVQQGAQLALDGRDVVVPGLVLLMYLVTGRDLRVNLNSL